MSKGNGVIPDWFTRILMLMVSGLMIWYMNNIAGMLHGLAEDVAGLRSELHQVDVQVHENKTSIELYHSPRRER